MDVAHFLFGIFGNASALFLFLSPVITFWRIVANKSTESFSGVPYVMTLLNCLLSAWYGLPFVSPNNILVTTVNGTGALIETIYVLIFIIFAPRREKAKILGLFTFVLTVFSAVVLVSLLALHGNRRKIFCGFAAAIFSIIMYGSPLSIMKRSAPPIFLLRICDGVIRVGHSCLSTDFLYVSHSSTIVSVNLRPTMSTKFKLEFLLRKSIESSLSTDLEKLHTFSNLIHH